MTDKTIIRDAVYEMINTFIAEQEKSSLSIDALYILIMNGDTFLPIEKKLFLKIQDSFDDFSDDNTCYLLGLITLFKYVLEFNQTSNAAYSISRSTNKSTNFS